MSRTRRRRRRVRRAPRMQRGSQIINRLIAEGVLDPYDPELVMEMLITMTRWIISQYLTITEPASRRQQESLCGG